MTMLPNGNYEEIINVIQHECTFLNGKCVQYSWDENRLHLEIEQGDPYEDGFSCSFVIKYCPFCGYSIK